MAHTKKKPTNAMSLRKEPHILPKKPCAHPNEPYMLPKEPYILPKESYIFLERVIRTNKQAPCSLGT